MTCTYCQDQFDPWMCLTCKCRVVSVCKECHCEVIHGVLGPPARSRPSVSGPRDDNGPWGENNVRALEDAGDEA